MRQIGLVLLLLPMIVLGQGRADWANGSPYSDTRSMQIGGILTVIIMELSQATNEAGSNTKADIKNNLAFTPSGMLAKSMQGAGFDLPLKHETNNNGGTSQRGSVTGKLTVFIKGVDSTGNFIIEGTRTVNVNGDKQIMTLTGKVRPQDINPDNTVYSYNIGNADLNVTGKGISHSASRPGFLSRLFAWIL